MQLGIPQTTIHNCLHLHAYEMQIVPALKLDNKPRFPYLPDFCQTVKLTSGVGFSVMKQRFAYDEG
jgi:hypothetical protein